MKASTNRAYLCSISLTMLINMQRVMRVSTFSLRTVRHTSKLQRPSSAFHTTFPLHSTYNPHYDDYDSSIPYYKRPVVQWYPGHIAKAERQLQETIKAVDVVLEVRDARIPEATMHPMVPTWCAGKPRILVMTHVDSVMPTAIREWKTALRLTEASTIADKQVQNQAKQVMQQRNKYANSTRSRSKASNGAAEGEGGLSEATPIIFVNAKEGVGILRLKKQIIATGAYVHARREARGLLARPLRVGCLGFPNTGKSALINQLLGRRRARTANTPGVTRSLQWIRVSHNSAKLKSNKGSMNAAFELLDSPGIIPTLLENQEHAKLVAICNCIGEAAYDTQGIASHLCQLIVHNPSLAPDWHRLCRQRYRVEIHNNQDISTGDDVLHAVAESVCRGSLQDAARKILQDIRTGRMGLVCLQTPAAASSAEQDAQSDRHQHEQMLLSIEERDQALNHARDGGVELPESALNSGEEKAPATSEIGKGLFDGW